MFRDALIITRRELRDSIRDWRIVAPVLILALVFPFVMEIASRMALNLNQAAQAPNPVMTLPLTFVPFALLLVGFFPVSMALVIALESFVGEKERNSLEPLLASPLSDTSLYIGKLLGAMLLPLCASYVAMAAYSGTLYLQTGYVLPAALLLQIVLVTTVEAFVMVAGAVVISSHTTSVRAANLLAACLIIPMAFFVQGESLLLFWRRTNILWPLIGALIVIGIILVRMGLATFNREEILTREVDELNLKQLAARFRFYLLGGDTLSLRRIYVQDLPRLLRANRSPLFLTLGIGLAAIGFGLFMARQYPLPANLFLPARVPPGFENSISLQSNTPLPGLDTASIFVHNVRVLVLASGLALISFGSGALFVLMTPLALIGLLTGEVAQAGINPFLFLGAFILPHGIVEIPAAMLATAFALRLGAAIMAPPAGRPSGENFVQALADWVKVFVFLVLPMLLVAAFMEALLTPRLVSLFFGG